jgi:hypothetical protein
VNVLAGIGSIAAALYFAARHRGLGRPLEEQPYSPVERPRIIEESEDSALIFLKTAQSAVVRASIAIELDDCRAARVLLLAAQAAISQVRAHSYAMPSGEHRSRIDLVRGDIEGEIRRVRALYREKCVSLLAR